MNPSKMSNSKGQTGAKDTKLKSQPQGSTTNPKAIQQSQVTSLPSIQKLSTREDEIETKDSKILNSARKAQKGALPSINEEGLPPAASKSLNKSVSIDSKSKDQNNKLSIQRAEKLEGSKTSTSNLQAKAQQQVIDKKIPMTESKQTKQSAVDKGKTELIASQKEAKPNQKPLPKNAESLSSSKKLDLNDPKLKQSKENMRSLSTSRSENSKSLVAKQIGNTSDLQQKAIKHQRLEPLPKLTNLKKNTSVAILKRSVSIANINNTPRIESMRPKIQKGSSISSSKLNSTRINDHEFELERNHLVHSNKYADILMNMSPQFLEEPKRLASYMAKFADTELERAWIVFMWVTHNIKYDLEPSTKNKLTQDQDPLVVLDRRVAVSTGYCHLYKALVQLLGISCSIVQGHARTFALSSATKENSMSEHEWIALKIYGKWYLIDPTWAAGYVDSEKNSFVFDFEPFWFLTSPNEFIYRHLPKDAKWQFMDDKIIDEKGFLNLLFVNPIFFKYKLGVFRDYKNDDESLPHLVRVTAENGSDSLRVLSGLFQEKIICPPEIDLRVYVVPAEGGNKYEAFVQREKNHYTITASMLHAGMATIQIFARKFYEENFFKEAMKFNVNTLQAAERNFHQTPIKFNEYDMNRCYLYQPMFVSFSKGDKVFFRIKISNPSVTAVATRVKNDEDWRKLDKSETEKGIWEGEVIVEGMPLQVAVKTTTIKRFKPILEYDANKPDNE